jgi:hypothetical protein
MKKLSMCLVSLLVFVLMSTFVFGDSSNNDQQLILAGENSENIIYSDLLNQIAGVYDEPTTYSSGSTSYLSVIHGAGTGYHYVGTKVTIQADDMEYGSFVKWVAEPDYSANFEDVFSPATTFTMPSAGVQIIATYTGQYSGGSGSETFPYLISNKADLIELRECNGDFDKYFKMTTDIDLAGINFSTAVIASSSSVWGGWSGTPFSGVFDGNGHKISNLLIDYQESGYLGLFGRNDGVIKNLNIEDCLVNGGYYDYRIAGLVAYNSGSIQQVNVDGEITTDHSRYVGLLVGENAMSGTISECSTSGIISDNYESSTGYATGSASCVGGLVGYDRGCISNSYSSVDVFGETDVGGLIGCKKGGIVVSSYACGDVSGNYETGGLIGRAYGLATVETSFWDTENSGQPTSDGGVGKTTVEMQTESTFTDVGWNFVDVWEKIQYPVLKCQLLYSGGYGTELNPYLIANKVDLLELSSNTEDYDKYFKMVDDIDLDGESFTMAVIAPDTSSSSSFQGTKFTGSFDGNGNKILNLSIDGGATSDYIGLFGYLDSEGEIKNIGVVDFSVIGDAYISGLCGYNNEGTISSCYSTGAVSGDGDYAGGLCGRNAQGTIVFSYSEGTVAGDDKVGGLCGYNDYGTISSCYSTGTVSGGDDYVGGLCGYSEEGTISLCYSTGAVSGDAYVGGLVGKCTSTVASSFWDTETSGTSTSAGGTGKTTVQMQTQSTFTGWNFVDTWKMNGYPVLQVFNSGGKTYQSWLTDLNVPINKQEHADDPSGDGIQNLLKYAIGLNPMEACSTADLMEPAADDTDGASIIYNKSKDAENVQLFPIWSDCLVPADWSANGFEFEKMYETDSQETWKATHSVTGECGYMRLKAQED